MIIKTFVGESSAVALKQVRAELGGDAVVLATRRVANAAGGYDTEVTACLDGVAPSTPKSTAAPVVNSRKITKPVWNRMVTKAAPQPSTINMPSAAIKSPTNATTDAGIELLRDLDIPTTVISEITSAISSANTMQEVVTNQIAGRIGTLPHFKAGDRVLVLGPNGAGKTSVVSKLAAQLASKKQTVTLVGFQQQKIGSVDELQSIADLVGIDCVDDCASGTNQNSVTLIDCGTLAVTTEEVATLNPTHTLFVVAAIMRGADLRGLASGIGGLRVSSVCMTMLDQTHRLGSLFTACDSLNAPLTMVCTSAFGAESLTAPNASAIASKMIGKGENHA